MSGKRDLSQYLSAFFAATFLGLSLVVPMTHGAFAADQACKKVGTKRVQAGKTYVCKKVGKKLVWRVTATVKSDQPTPTTSPSPTATPTSSSANKCSGDSLFKRLPVDFSKISVVAPIGTLAPIGGSPLPKHHAGLMLNEPEVPLIAPGDLTITEIREVRYLVSPRRAGFVDYAIFFSVCDEVTGHFGHVSNLNADLKPPASAYQCSKYSTVDETVESCSARTSIKVSEGTRIATSDNDSSSPAIDMGMYDTRLPSDFINTTRFPGPAAGTLCPWDFFASGPKAQLYSKIGLSAEVLSTENPKCGTMAVDKSGTAAGRWTPQANPGTGQDPADGRFLVFTQDTYLPESRIAFSTRIAEIASSTQYQPLNYPKFPLQSSGRVNIAPSRVTADGQIYCYVVDATASTESFLISLVNDGQLKVEKLVHSPGATACNQSPSQWSFSSGAVILIR